MKRFSLLFMMSIGIVILVGCFNRPATSRVLNQVGVAPYELSEDETYLLQSLGMEDKTQMISFKAPKEAVSLQVNVYCLGKGDTWDPIGTGAVAIGQEPPSADPLEGIFTMNVKENYAIDFHINGNGLAAYTTEEMILDTEATASVAGFLDKFQEIKINKEIPVALLVYDNGTTMKSYSLQDYFEPARLRDMDLVQAVMLTFCDKDTM